MVTATTERKKRIRRDPATTRALILDMTEKLMVEEGYAAVSSRRIAQEIGINGATIHYYYPTTDDIFVALHSRMSERQLELLEQVVASDDPLGAFWKYQSSGDQTALGVEFLALANHRKSIREKLAASTEQSRGTQSDMLERTISQAARGRTRLSPLTIGTILIALGRLIANEERVGITRGHDEIKEVVEEALAWLRQPASQDQTA